MGDALPYRLRKNAPEVLNLFSEGVEAIDGVLPLTSTTNRGFVSWLLSYMGRHAPPKARLSIASYGNVSMG